MTTQIKNNASAPVHASFQEAFAATAKDRAALFPDQLATINLDVEQVVATVLGTVPTIHNLRETASKLPDFDVAQLDALQSYAEALAHAQRIYRGATEPVDVLPELAARASELRDLLLADAKVLARRKLIDGNRLAELQGGNGYLAAGSDVGVLVDILRENWSTIASKSAVQATELDEADQLFERITKANAERSQPGRTAIAADDDRRRAYTLVLGAYDQARRAAAFLRWSQQDADKLVPSLWAGRGGRGKPKVEEPIVGNEETVPADLPEPVAPVVPVAPGMPGGAPFTV